MRIFLKWSTAFKFVYKYISHIRTERHMTDIIQSWNARILFYNCEWARWCMQNIAKDTYKHLQIDLQIQWYCAVEIETEQPTTFPGKKWWKASLLEKKFDICPYLKRDRMEHKTVASFHNCNQMAFEDATVSVILIWYG